MSSKPSIVPPTNLDDGALREADAAAVLEYLISGTPIDPAVMERVRARAEQITADIRRDHGVLDDDTFQSLLDDEA